MDRRIVVALAALAVAFANDRALHLVRVNEGLHTLDQLPLTRTSSVNLRYFPH